ncbi:MAG: hypothetical protein QNJ32_18415, partial [Xenococcaceae cyanobacterium MO_167.B27]|nr:hypothetical protein [Xenococcaceae cyanobacterium MO_167.B27]
SFNTLPFLFLGRQVKKVVTPSPFKLNRLVCLVGVIAYQLLLIAPDCYWKKRRIKLKLLTII